MYNDFFNDFGCPMTPNPCLYPDIDMWDDPFTFISSLRPYTPLPTANIGVVENPWVATPMAAEPMNHILNGDHTPIEITDIFGTTHVADPFNVDIMSGMEIRINSGITEHIHNLNVKTDALIAERDAAVQHYHNAINQGNLDEAAKWENLANDKQSELNTALKTPNYSLGPVRAPGL